MFYGQGCTSVKEGTQVRKGFDLPINSPNGDQHYLVCTLTLTYGACKCGRCTSPEVVVSDPVSGQMDAGDGWVAADGEQVAMLFELAKGIDQEELLGWFE